MDGMFCKALEQREQIVGFCGTGTGVEQCKPRVLGLPEPLPLC